MRLRVLIGAFGFGQLAGFEIDVIVALAGTVDAISPMQAGVEPLRAVRGGHLIGQHEPHFVVIGARVFLGGEITPLPAPIGPSPGKTVKNLLGADLAAGFNAVLCGHRAPQEFGNTLFLHLLQTRGHARLAEIFLSDDVASHLAPAVGHFDIVEAEHRGAIGIADL